MLVHLLTQCVKITNREKRAKLKETEFPWLEEEYVLVYFRKLDKEQERLNKMEIKWDDTQKVTQAVDEMYNSILFDVKQMMEWEDKDNVNMTWGTCNMFFIKYYKLKKMLQQREARQDGIQERGECGRQDRN